MSPAELSSIANHLWQSTVFAALAWLLTLALRRNHARIRHGVWLAALSKFFIPFLLLIALGSQIQWPTAPETAQPGFTIAMTQISRPFAAPVVSLPMPPAASRRSGSPLPGVLFGIWLCGFIGISFSWWVRWRRIRTAARGGTRVPLETPITVVSTPAMMEPGIFGIIRPILLLPEGIREILTPAQLKSVIEHELCHVRHRDNLSAAIQMLVETAFWFHPMVWWIGKCMVEERERACDEEVLRMLAEPRVYADAILSVCKLYVESPLVCVSGVSGANLRKRIEEIMANRPVFKLNAGRKLLLAAGGAVAMIVPVAIGVVNASQIQAQPQPGKTLAFEAASVKPHGGDRSTRMFPTVLPGGRFVSRYYLAGLISFAYKLPSNPSIRLTGVPDWARAEAGFFDVEATGVMPAGLSSQAREDRMRLMVQTLLVDRFKLVIHRESKEMPVYALVVSKGGPRLQRSDIAERDCPSESADPPGPSITAPDLCHEFNGGQGRGLHGRAVDMSDLARFVENWTDRPLVDKTGLKGLFRIETKGWLPMQLSQPPAPGAKAEDGSDMADVPTLFQLFEQLGLKMDSQKGKADVYVIDHVEKPSEN